MGRPLAQDIEEEASAAEAQLSALIVDDDVDDGPREPQSLTVVHDSVHTRVGRVSHYNDGND